MSATSDPPRIARDVHAQDVAGMSAEGLCQGPVVGGEDVDVFVEAGGDEECA